MMDELQHGKKSADAGDFDSWAAAFVLDEFRRHITPAEWFAKSDRIQALEQALKDLVVAYDRQNPMRTADCHNPACASMRCAVDNARALSTPADSNSDIREGHGG